MPLKIKLLEKGTWCPSPIKATDQDNFNRMIREHYERFPHMSFKERLAAMIEVAEFFGTAKCKKHGKQPLHVGMCKKCYHEQYYRHNPSRDKVNQDC